MIHLAILISIGLLVFRILWVIATLFQNLFQRQQTQSTAKKDSTIQNTQISQASQTSQTKKNATVLNSNTKISTQNPPIKKIVPQRLQEPIKFQKPKDTSKVNSEQTQSKVISQSISKSESSFSQEQKDKYESVISKMKIEIEEQQKEKLRYLQRIEEIIQIVNKNQIHQLNNSQEEELPMKNLRNEIAIATNRMKMEKIQLQHLFEKEKTFLINSYEEKIHDINQKHNEKTTQYLTIIDDITQRVYQLEEEKSQQISRRQNSGETSSSAQLAKERKKNLDLTNEKQKIAQQAGQLRTKVQKLQEELDKIRKIIIKKENDAIQTQTRLEAQIKSLTEQQTSMNQELAEQKQTRFKFEQELEQEVFKHQHDKIQAEDSSKSAEVIEQLRIELNEEKNLRLEEQKKTQQTIEELKFCQEQLKNSRETEVELRAKLIEAVDAPKRLIIRKEDVEKHPEYMALKRKLDQLEGRKLILPENNSSILEQNYKTSRETKEISPTFPIDNQRTTSPNSDYRGGYKTGENQEDKGSRLAPSLGFYIDKRYLTPNVKNTYVSSTLRAGSAGSYLGETNILNEAQRNLIVHEVSALKKITIRKTSLLYTSANKQGKPIIEYIVGVPNLLVVVQLANKNIIGAFTQNAFSKSNQFTHSTIMTKAMIFSLTPQTFIVNQNKGEAIHFEENILIWGHKEIVIDCNEPYELSAELNCEEAVYPTAISTQEFMGGKTQKVPIVKIEAYRNFFG